MGTEGVVEIADTAYICDGSKEVFKRADKDGNGCLSDI